MLPLRIHAQCMVLQALLCMTYKVVLFELSFLVSFIQRFLRTVLSLLKNNIQSVMTFESFFMDFIVSERFSFFSHYASKNVTFKKTLYIVTSLLG